MINAEKNYVKSLRIVQKCMRACRKHVGTETTSLFTERDIEQLFKNIDQLVEFAIVFLDDMKSCINTDCLQKSMLGSLFVRHQQDFKRVYTPFCTNQTIATCRFAIMTE
ncbi:RhoGEF domain-containing protein, partial [Salmonella sp. s51228]|uniref:RhoGEF domain-containing protein n=1 Tax=Salmonella sp. s51228 TaxID=3159652 RepID=UPI003980DD00